MQRKTRAIGKRLAARFSILSIHQTESRGVPDLVGKVAIGLNLLVVPAHVGRTDRRQSQARGIDAEFVKDFERIDPVRFRFRHPLAMLVCDRAGDVDVVERFRAHELQTRHHHPRDPKKDYVARGYQHRCRIERFQVRVSSGQPIVENGHRAEENQVSSTSSS